MTIEYLLNRKRSNLEKTELLSKYRKKLLIIHTNFSPTEDDVNYYVCKIPYILATNDANGFNEISKRKTIKYLARWNEIYENKRQLNYSQIIDPLRALHYDIVSGINIRKYPKLYNKDLMKFICEVDRITEFVTMLETL